MGKRSPDPISTGHRRLSRDPLPSPTSPLERSPKGWKNRESDGVGLGIVVALKKSSSGDLTAAKVVVNFPRVLSPRVPISSTTTTGGSSRFEVDGCYGKRTKRCCDKQGFWDDGCEEMGLFHTSPPRSAADEFSGFPVSGFLSSCHLCRKKLDGKDIYMYRGEKAFCSTDCRYRQIVADEYQESCGYAASRPSEISTSVDYSGQRLFHTGIMAA